MRTTKPTKLAFLGRAAAVKAFTRNNNKSIQLRKRLADPSATATTQPRSAACLKLPLFLLCTLAILAISATPAMAEFGIKQFAISARNQNGTPDVQAGSHPYALNTTVVLNEPGPTTGNLKDVRLELPPGLVGNPDASTEMYLPRIH